MIDYTNLKRYADNLVLNSKLFSEEEGVGLRILTLMSHAHNVEMILEKLKKDVECMRLHDEDTTALENAIRKIEGK